MSAWSLPVIAALLLGLIALGLIVYGVNGFLARGKRLSQRLQTGKSVQVSGGVQQSLLFEEGPLKTFEQFLTPEDPERYSKIRMRLIRAGYRGSGAVRVYFAAKWGIAILGTLFFGLLFATILEAGSGSLPLVAMVLGALLSFFATDLWIARRAAYRQLDIENGFPDALDLLLVCIEAGHSLDQGLSRVARDLRTSSPKLAEELTVVVNELLAGKNRSAVLTDFSDRTNVSDVAAFATVIKQADKFGVSIADSIRVHAREMRDKRYMRAEEKANLMPVKLALAAIVFTIPPVILILIGPSLVMIVREMARAGAGGG